MTKIHLKHLKLPKQRFGVNFYVSVYFGHFLGFWGILVIFQLLEVFWSFSRFQGYFGNFQVLGDISIFFFRFMGYFGHFQVSGGISVILWFWGGYFGHFLGFVGISFIFQVLGVFQSFCRFRRYFGHFLGLGGILVILLVSGGISTIFQVQGVFW